MQVSTVGGTVTFTAAEKRACAEREWKIRQRVYPNRIETGRMTEAQAKREIAMMAAIMADYAVAAERERLI